MFFIVVLIIWIVSAGCVAAAAEARGREGFGWLVLSLLLSPLIAILLLLVFPNLREQALLERVSNSSRSYPPALPPPLPEGPFEPDGVFAGIPYKVRDNGAIDAIMQGSKVAFRDYEKFTQVVGPLS